MSGIIDSVLGAIDPGEMRQVDFAGRASMGIRLLGKISGGGR